MEKEKYKINFHAHTRYSDGHGTIKEMAQAYKDKGFCCAVITDHWYGRHDLVMFSMSYEKYLKACEEAKEVSKELDFPVIIGVEYGFFRCEEALRFGHEFIKALYTEVQTIQDFEFAKDLHEGAVILAHPGLSKSETGFIGQGGQDVIDGYEWCNGGCGYMFHWRDIPKELDGLTQFANSDAHGMDRLDRCHNLVNEKITTEKQLTNYIREKKPIEMVISFKMRD